MPTNTDVALDKVTVVGTSTTSVTLSGISGSYTDLRLVINSQNQNSTYQPYIQFNSDTGTGTTNYSTTVVRGDGTNAASGRHTNQIGWYPVPGPGVGTTGNFQPWIVDIMNYSNTTTYKVGLSKFNNAASIVSASSHLWRSTAAITSITITAEANSGYIAPGSTFSLYGIRAEGTSPTVKATGGDIYSDSTYYYHVFDASGTFTPTQSITADVLVVAGGGGAGSRWGGGGGAGGLLAFTSQSLTATGYTCTVGSGGAGGGGTTTGGIGSVGGDSQFGSLTLVKGGGWGLRWLSAQTLGAAGTGGSGGGATSTANGSTSSAGAATSGQGFAGGGSSANAAGGGGAGGAGNAGDASKSGDGGVGSSSYSSWGVATGIGQNVAGTYYLAGGGGGGTASSYLLGGTGGLGGGGNGNFGTTTNQPAGNGQTNTGGGGGGAGNNGDSSSVYGGNGGSGVIIVRYAK